MSVYKVLYPVHTFEPKVGGRRLLGTVRLHVFLRQCCNGIALVFYSVRGSFRRLLYGTNRPRVGILTENTEASGDDTQPDVGKLLVPPSTAESFSQYIRTNLHQQGGFSEALLH